MQCLLRRGRCHSWKGCSGARASHSRHLWQREQAAGAPGVQGARGQALGSGGQVGEGLLGRQQAPVGAAAGQQHLAGGRAVGGEVVSQLVLVGVAIERAVVGQQVRLAV